MKITGERIKHLLKKHKIKRSQLAEKMGVSTQMISYWCIGTNTPNVENLRKLSKIFDISVDYLLGLSDSKRIAEQIESDDEFVSSAIEKITSHYGKSHQSEILVEECAELIQAVQKCKRNNTDISENLKEEIADVMIMCLQMREFVGKGSIDDIIVEKLQRQLERIEEENEKDVQDV